MKALRVTLMYTFVFAVCFAAVFISGCGPVQMLTPIGPRGLEWGHVPTGNFDPFPGSLAGFGLKAFDGNGIIYTHKAGTIDPAHIYGDARKALSAYNSAYSALMEGKQSFSSNAMDVVINSYPTNWDAMPEPEKKKIAHEVATELAKSIAFHCEVYHELQTWWGGGIDYQSSFSWEDYYSDALGVDIAMKAKAKELQGSGSAAGNITTLTQSFVNSSQYVSSAECNKIVKSLENIAWTSGTINRSLLWRNVDVGADGFIDNTPIPGFTSPAMTRIIAPRMDYSNFKGFNIDVFVGSGSSYSGKAAKLLGVNRINIKDHPRLMQIVGKEFEAKGHKVWY